MPTEQQVTEELDDKLRVLRDAFDAGALCLEGYLSAMLMNVQDAAQRRPGIARATRRMQQAVVPHAMNGKHVQVVTMEDHPFTTKVSDTPLNYVGFCPDMLQEMSQLANFTYEWVPVTAAETNNGWAGMVNDVANGHTDMFWATAFLTSQRAALVDVTASFMDSGLQVVSLCNLQNAQSSDGFVDWALGLMEAPFSPFSRALWVATFVAMVSYAGLMYVLERPSDLARMDAEERSMIPPGPLGVAHGLFNEMYLTLTFLTVGAGREPEGRDVFSVHVEM